MSNNVWAVLQLRDGQVSRAALETIAAAQKLAAAIGGQAEAVVLGSGVGAAATSAAGRDLAAVHVADHADLAGYTPGAFIGALAPALRAAQPAF
ncbi:MAG TPA: electron transfer flavoprotein subunit alpha/FixB family protein, partial [Thermoanaerobaculia bacterium]|nr:electron transfer flavoprotein subunit alpha/FixB family protein [Thermoanaerobaculia bacterium]